LGIFCLSLVAGDDRGYEISPHHFSAGHKILGYEPRNSHCSSLAVYWGE
jgi:hypothetical protein